MLPKGQLLSPKEVAALCGVHPETVKRMARRGDLPVVRIGGVLRFRPVDIEVLTTPTERDLVEAK